MNVPGSPYKMEITKRELNIEQKVFAQWLSLPENMRSPSKQQDLAKQLNVSEATLCTWKKDPRIIELKMEHLNEFVNELLPKALRKMADLMYCDNARVAFDVCKYITDAWGSTRAKWDDLAVKEFYEWVDTRAKGAVIEGEVKEIE